MINARRLRNILTMSRWTRSQRQTAGGRETVLNAERAVLLYGASGWRILYYYCLLYVNMQHVVGRRRAFTGVRPPYAVRFRWAASCISTAHSPPPTPLARHNDIQSGCTRKHVHLFTYLSRTRTINKTTIIFRRT